MSSLYLRMAGAFGVALILAGCAAKARRHHGGQARGPPKPPACVPVKSGDPMVGTWYSSSKPRGVSGDFQSLTVLRADGTMAYETQLKIGRKTRPALRESGCWTVADGVYTMRTTVSNGEIVDFDDPIYLNRYRVEKVEQAKLTLRELKSGGQVVTARRMPQGYRLPY